MASLFRNYRQLILFWSLLLLYYHLRLFVFFSPAIIPDEESFLYTSRAGLDAPSLLAWLKVVFTGPNHLGYGSSYWSIYAFFSWINREYAFYLMRGFCLVANALTPLLIFFAGVKRKSPFTILAVLLWLALPLSWWCGKITGPEYLAILMTACGLFLPTLIYPTKRWATFIGALCIGFSLGLKLNSLPVAIAALALLLLKSQKTLVSTFSLWIGGAALGFLFANPSMPLAPWDFWVRIREQSYGPRFDWKFLSYILDNHFWEWDAVFSGGFFQWGPQRLPLLLFISFLLLGNRNRSFLYVFVFSFATALLMMLSNARFLGWYWFPFLLLFPYGILQVETDNPRQRKLGWALAASTLIFGLPTILSELDNRWQHHHNLHMANATNYCLVEHLQNQRMVPRIYDFSEFGFRLDTHFLNDASKIYYRDGLVAWNNLSAFAKVKPGESATDGVLTLILVNDRLSAHTPFHDPWKFFYGLLDRKNLKAIDGAFTCNTVHAFLIR